MDTPDPPGYETLPWPDDVLAAWIEGSDGAKETVREAWPDLAAALDREAEVVQRGDKGRPRWLTPPEHRRPVPWQEPGA